MRIAPDAPELTVVGRIPSGSNMVFLCTDPDGDRWVYKPVRGERPLHDFPDGTLAAREVATYVISESLGWGLVPETRPVTGPGGAGMGQRWVTESGGGEPVGVFSAGSVPAGWVSIVDGEDEAGTRVVVAHDTSERLRRVALLDHVINNADRKGGHLLVDTAGTTWAIDHGLALHSHPKVRTVLWGWAGTELHVDDVPALHHLSAALRAADGLPAELSELLSREEVEALAGRVTQLLDTGEFPVPGPGYPLPWPLF